MKLRVEDGAPGWDGTACPFGFFGCINSCEIQGFLDAERATNICITLCLKGFLRSRWSVEMTDVWGVGL